MTDLEIIRAIGEVARRAREPDAYQSAAFWRLKRETFEAMAASYRSLGDDIRADECEKHAREADVHFWRCVDRKESHGERRSR